MTIWEMFTDGEYVSWMRVIGAFVILVASVGFLFSVFTANGPGILASTGLIGSVLTLKGYQTKKEVDAANALVASPKKE